jgi:predicted TIM-barrel fold metal-dependent hydrolase
MTSDLEFCDVHQHVGDSSQSHGGMNRHVAAGAAESEFDLRIQYMDDAGIRQTLVHAGFSYDRSGGIEATRSRNDELARYRDAKPDRIVPSGIVEPRDTSTALDEVRRIANELRMVGITFHTQYQGVTIDSRPMLDILALMGELNLVPLIHTPDDCLHESLSRLAKVARALPDLTIVALEPFYLLEGLLTCDLIAEIAPNVLFDTAECWDFDHLVTFANRWGSSRLLYGSHRSSVPRAGAMRRSALQRQEIETAPDLTDNAKHDIAQGNWKRVFGPAP